MDASLDSSIDALETAFSDSTRRVIRQITVEWERVLNCRKHLAEKEEEWREAMEKKTRLREIVIQNENYLKSAEKRLEDLKLSKSEHKRQVNKLEKEKEKVVKSCNEQEENMCQKIAFYEEKWRKRYDSHYSKNPRKLKKAKRINEVLELNKKLRILTEEEKKYEKELFRVKSRRIIFTEQTKLYPFQNFVVNIAKIFLETKEIYGECKKMFREIAEIESRIKSKRQILSHGKTFSFNVTQDFEQNPTEETNLKDNNVYLNPQIYESYNTEAELAKDINFKSNIDVEKDNSSKCIKSFPNDLSNASSNAYPNSLSKTENQTNILKVKNDDCSTKAAKVVPNEPKARKWMERLKIFVPKFRTISEENIVEHGNSTKPVVSADTKIEEKRNLPFKSLNGSQPHNVKTTNTENLEKNTSLYKNFSIEESVQSAVSPLAKKVRLHDTALEVTDNSTIHQIAFQNTSKYFKTIDEKVEPMDWDKELTCEKRDDVKPVIQNYVTPNKSEDKRNKQGKITEIKIDSNEDVLKVNEPMDVDEQINTKQFETSSEKMSKPETGESVVENVQMASLLLQTNHEREITSSLTRNERSFYSFTSNEKETFAKYQNMDTNTSLLEPNSVAESKLSFGCSERRIRSFSPNEKKTINTYQNSNMNSSLSELNPVMENKSFTESNETSTYSSVLNKIETINKYQYRNVNPGQVQKEVPLQHKADDTKIFNADNTKPVIHNVGNDASKQHRLHHRFDSNIQEALVLSNNDSGNNTGIITPKEMNTHEENIQHVQINALRIDGNIRNKSPQSIPANRVSYSSVEPSPKNSPSDCKTPNPPNPKTPSPMDTNVKTPLTMQLQNLGESPVGMDSSSFVPYKADSNSSGFPFTTRLMYPTNAGSSKQGPSEMLPTDPQSSILAQMAFLNQVRSPDEEKSKFLVDFEDYLTDSPPVIKEKEKSMFAFAEDSLENEDKNDFFPLFGSNNGDADRDTGNRGGAFTFNFGNDSQAQSPEENKGFKFLF